MKGKGDCMTGESDLTPEQIRQLIDGDRQQRIEACRDEITAVLQKHRCNLEAVATITQRGTQVAVQLTAVE